MPMDDPQLRALLNSQLISAEEARQLAEAARASQSDAIALLQHHGRLSPEQAARLREQARDPRSLVHLERTGELGRGGMGVVYEVFDHRAGRHAALKLLLDSSDPLSAERFLREAQVTARLDHPSIPAVYEFAAAGPLGPYMLMKVIRGRTLRALIDEAVEAEALEEQRTELIQVLIKVCEAVDCAHDQDIVHRDLKPSNIIVGEYGEVMVMDWGLARDRTQAVSDQALEGLSIADSELAEGSAGGLTMAGAVLGTPGYMSPEQANGEAVDVEADIFALGVMLTELLTGQRPIAGGRVLDLLKATIRGDIASPRALDRSIPRPLDALAVAAMRPEASTRLPSAGLLAADLRAWVEGRPLGCYRYGLRERAARWARLRLGRVLAAASASIILILALGLGLTAQLAQENERQRERAEANRRRNEEALRLLSEAALSLEVGRESVYPLLERAVETGDSSAAKNVYAAYLLMKQAGGDREQVLGRVQKWLDAAEELPDRDEVAMAPILAAVCEGRGALSPEAIFAIARGLERRNLQDAESQAYIAGVRAHQAGDLDGAAVQFAIAARSQVLTLPSRLMLLDIAVELDRPDAVVSESCHLYVLGASHPELLTRLAYALYGVRRYDLAYSYLSMVMVMRVPNRAVAELRLILCMELGLPRQAIEAFNQIKSTGEPTSMHRLVLAETLLASGRVADASKLADKVLATEPGNPTAVLITAEILERTGNRPAAVAFVGRVADSGDPAVALRGARVYIDCEAYQSALDLLQSKRGLAYSEAQAAGYRELVGRAMLGVGRAREALPQLNEAVGFKPRREALAARAQCFNILGLPEDAQRDGNSARLLSAEPTELVPVILPSLVARGAYEEVRRLALDVKARHRQLGPTFAALGVALSNLGQLQGARDAFAAAAFIDPTDPYVAMVCAGFAIYEDKLVSGAKTLDAALAKTPDGFDLTITRAEISRRMGDVEDSRRRLQALLDASSGHPRETELKLLLKQAGGSPK